MCNTSGVRRSWLREIEHVRRLRLPGTISLNLGLVLSMLPGTGKVRSFAAMWSRHFGLKMIRLARRDRPSLLRAPTAFGKVDCQVHSDSG
ncbi:MAG: hypothetical protein KDA52_23300 [Planctomycetaceae bacterium]|nr:hypothetical protein [Planctomycetaceae bacterium]